MARRIEVEIIGDSRSLERAFARSERSAKDFNHTMESAGRGAIAGSLVFKGFGRSIAYASGSFLGGAGLVAAMKSSVNAASDLNEQIGKTDVVFGKSAAAVEAWAKTTSTSFAISERQALATASSFGALFAPIGIRGQSAADLSRQLTELGADLASFSNTPVQDALDAIRSGLVGESEPLRQYGVQLSEARVQQEAFRETGKRSAGDLTNQEKTLARINLILRDTVSAQGDSARSAGRLAQQQKELAAQVDELQTQLGQALVPALTKGTTKMNEWLANPQNKKQVVDDFTTSVNALASAFLFAADAVGKYKGAQSGLEQQLGKLGFLTKSLPGQLRMFADNWRRLKHDLGLDAGTTGDFAGKLPGGGGGGNFPVPTTTGGGPAGTSGAGQAGMTARQLAQLAQKAAEQRNTWFDSMIDRLLGRAGDPTSLRAQISRYQQIAGLLTQRLAVTKDITRRLRLEDELADVAMSIRDRQDQIADKARADAAARRDDQMGWLDFAVERAGATKTLADDRSALRAKEKFLKDLVRHEGRSLELVSELWRTRQQIRDLNKKNAGVDPLAGLMQVSTRQLTNILAAGTGLGVLGRAQLGRNIAGAEIQHIHVHIDGREVGAVVATQQARDGRRTARQTSGFRG